MLCGSPVVQHEREKGKSTRQRVFYWPGDFSLPEFDQYWYRAAAACSPARFCAQGTLRMWSGVGPSCVVRGIGRGYFTNVQKATRC